MESRRVESAISFLLHLHDCVIIPGLGALVANYSPAKSDPERGLMFPPSKEISFNPSLTRDDALLADHLASRQGISHSEAKSIISGYVKGLKESLAATRKYTISGIGEFSSGSNKKISFLPFREENFLAASYGLFPVSIIVDKRKVPVTAVSRKRSLRQALVVLPLVAVLGTMSWLGMTDTGFRSQLSSVLPSMVESHTEYRERYPFKAWEEEKVTLSANLVNSQKDRGTLFVDLSDEKEAFLWPVRNNNLNAIPVNLRSTPKSAPENSVEVAPKSKTLPEKKPIVEKVPAPEKKVDVKPENPKISAPASASSAPFHVITGCFSVKDNAEKHIAEMKAAGLDVFIAGFEKGLYRVSAGGFTSRSEASAKRSVLKSGASPSAWIWKKK